MNTSWIVGLLLLVVSTAHSLSSENEEHPKDNQPLEEDNEVQESVVNTNEDDDEDSLDKDAAMSNDEDYQYSEKAAAMDTDLMDMAEYQKEVNMYLEQDKLHKNDRVKRQNFRGHIKSGDTIALQTFVKDFYAACFANPCGRSHCPKAHMTGHDWIKCWGEVFHIYKLGSPGVIRVGDMVGIYYPREFGRWLGCAGHKCGKATCPGGPSLRYGFSNRKLISRCWGEVFRIYVKGKRNRSIVNSNDEVSFYYVRGRLWISQGYHQMVRRPCLGRSFPPAVWKYDRCAHETFTIWKRNGR